MLQIIWEYRVAPEQREAFEALYGAHGDWAQLFQRSPEYRGTTLLSDPAVPGRYLTIDSWNDAAGFDRFHETFAAEYKSMDSRCAELTQYEMKVGAFTSL